jgi:arylsulfotransferase ASST
VRLFVTVTALALVASACSDSSTSPTSSGATIRGVSVAPNPNSALSAIVTFTAERAESASVSFSSLTDPGSSTPWYPVANSFGHITVLGMLANMTYTLVVHVAGRNITSDTIQFTTGALPNLIQQMSLTLTQGTLGSGYTLLAALSTTDTVTAVAFDSIGRVRWYREIPGWNSGDIKMQHNGNFTAALSGVGGSMAGPGEYVEFSPAGDIVATFNVPVGLPDIHEFWLTGDSVSGYSAHMWAYAEIRQLDLSGVGPGGTANEPEYGHTLFRAAQNGDVEFAYTTWNYYGVADWIEPTCCAPNLDFDHPNVIDFAPDSNYIISFRNFGAVAKIDRATGKRIWQLGGTQSTLTFLNDPLGFFSGQHNAHFLANGDLVVFDNGLRHNPPHSRAAEYAINESAKTATLVWEYEPQPMVFASFIGSVGRLSNGNTLVGFGALGQIDEVDPVNNLLARAFFTSSGKLAQFYRAYRLPSLYKYQAP